MSCVMTVYFIGLMLPITRLYSLRDVALTRNHCQFTNQVEGKFETHSSPLGDQIKDIGSASQTLLTGVRLPL